MASSFWTVALAALNDAQPFIQIISGIEEDADRRLLETPLSTDQRATEMEDRLEIVAAVADSAQLKLWLRSFGSVLVMASLPGLLVD